MDGEICMAATFGTMVVGAWVVGGTVLVVGTELVVLVVEGGTVVVTTTVVVGVGAHVVLGTCAAATRDEK